MKRFALLLGCLLVVAGCSSSSSEPSPVDKYHQALEIFDMERTEVDRLIRELEETPQAKWGPIRERLDRQKVRYHRAIKWRDEAEKGLPD